LRLVIVVAEHRIHAEFGRQRRDLLHRIAMPHDQVAAQLRQFGIHFGNAGVDEIDAAVARGSTSGWWYRRQKRNTPCRLLQA
jgi:hypothetical protein